MAKDVLTDLDLKSASRILNLQIPVDPAEPVRLADLDAAIQGLKSKDPVVASSQGNINLASPGAAIDGVTLASNDRVLIRVQTAGTENGIYIFNGATSAMTRADDANTAAELTNALVPVVGGTNDSQDWRQVTTIATLGVDTVSWVLFGVTVGQATESSSGTAEIATQTEVDTGTDDSRIVSALKLKNWSGKVQRAGLVIGDGAATQFDLTHNFNSLDVIVIIRRNAVPYDDILCEIERTDVNTVRLRFTSAPAVNQFKAVVIA